MLSVIIHTKNGEPYLLDVLRPLVAAAADGAVRDVVFFDLGSRDGTAMIADAAGAIMVPVPKEREKATDVALKSAHRADWVLMLDQATVLTAGWLEEAMSFVERQNRIRTPNRMLSAAFRPEHEPELGSADVKRRASVVFANRVLSVGRLSQGLLARRSHLRGVSAPSIDWRAADPAVKLPNLMRLRSCTHLAQPMEPLEEPENLATGETVAETG
ncbi:MAG: glycosyltransferase [Pseudomonadota bacterium]